MRVQEVEQELQEMKSLDKSLERSMDTSTETETQSDALLRINADGLLGVLERVPLVVKLCAMSLVALVGMAILAALLLGITGRDIHTARQQYQFSQLADRVGQFIITLQDEREITTEFISNATTSLLDVARAYQRTSRAYNTLRTAKQGQMSDISSALRIQAKMQEIEAIHAQLEYQRGLVYERNLSIADCFYYYRDFIQLNLEYLGLYVQVSGATSASVNSQYFLRSYELQQQVRLIAVLASLQGAVVREVHSGMNRLSSTRDYMFQLWYNSATIPVREEYDNQTSRLWTRIQAMELEVSTDREVYPYQNLTFTLDNYKQSTGILNRRMRAIQNVLLSNIEAEARKAFSLNTALIVVSVIVIVLFFLLSLLGSVVVSFTIIGPWRRLNVIQEQAITKFVPQGFLRLIGCYKITDVSLGKHVERNLTMLRVDIRDFGKLTHGMTYDQIFSFLNDYLAHISPLIRKHSGFVDRYDGSMFLALFKHQKQASRACLDIQSETELFNKNFRNLYPSVNVGMSVHSGSVLVGTVGENVRMQGTIISHHLETSVLLERIAKKFATNILTTRLTKKFKFRTLGHILNELPNGHTENVKVYELLHEECSQLIEGDVEADLFTDAVRLMENGKITEALHAFQKIDSKDKLTQKYIKKLKSIQAACFSLMAELSIGQVLGDEHLQEQFELFTHKEHSEENIMFWKAIESFRSIPFEAERRQMAIKLQQTYLSLDGMYTININEQLKKMISETLGSEYSEVRSDLFDPIQLELEILMQDTYKRFRESALESQMVEQSTYAPEVPCLDEL